MIILARPEIQRASIVLQMQAQWFEIEHMHFTDADVLSLVCNVYYTPRWVCVCMGLHRPFHLFFLYFNFKYKTQRDLSVRRTQQRKIQKL